MKSLNDEKILVILDIDETLLHATQNQLERTADFKLFDYHIYLRPHLNSFLNKIKDDFSLAVWSSASDDYVEAIIEKIIPKDIELEFVWGRSRCTPRRFLQVDSYGNYENRYLDHYNYIKPLKKVKKRGFNIDKILIIDDTPHKSSANFGNAIYPKEYLGDVEDNELLLLSKYLKTLKDEINVRSIEKRGWRNKIA